MARKLKIVENETKKKSLSWNRARNTENSGK
jgi:hypothetical protein